MQQAIRFASLLFITLAMTLSPSLPALTFNDLDDQHLLDSRYLRHLSFALAPGKNISAKDLISNGNIQFKIAPDPTPLLLDMQKKNNARQLRNTEKMRLISYNVALLEAKAFGLIPALKSPYLEERRALLPDRIFDIDADVIFLQEVWQGSVDFFEDAALYRGYTSFTGDKKKYDDGLMVLIRSSLVEQAKSVSIKTLRYETQYILETLGGPGVARGLLKLTLDHAELGPMQFYNTHLLSFRSNWFGRIQQARELGRHILETTAKDELVFVGGDLNAGPYYRDDTWAGYFSSIDGDWWKNAIAYPTLLHYGQLDDLMVMGLNDENADIDVRWGNRVINNPVEARRIPGALTTWCNDVSHGVFTATDCNSLHFMQYPGYEQPARQDHLLVRDTQNRVQVTKRDFLFTDRVPLKETANVELSDHYGILVEMNVEKL